MTHKIDVICCPRCQRVQDAEVTFPKWAPFPIYVHRCIDCGYYVTESDWDLATQSDILPG